MFNLALIKEKLSLFQESKLYYNKILSINTFFIDAYVKLGYIYFNEGLFEESMNILDKGFGLYENDKAKFLRFDKIICMKSTLLK